MHEITAGALYIAKREAYEIYKKQRKDQEDISEEEWEKSYEKRPIFKLWYLILKLELLLLEFLKSLRSGNSQYYIKTLKQITPWMFNLDHHNYARWLPVHLTQMIDLEEMHPSLFEKFSDGKFTVQKANRKFSKTALDQNHQQLNAGIKGVGGAIGLKNFFSQENQTSPSSLSENGHLRPAKSKSSIINCIEEENKIHQQKYPQVDSKIFDGGALVNMLRPVNCRTFDDYAQKVVIGLCQKSIASH